MNINFSKIPSPCYVIDEKLLRSNLEKIKLVKEKAGIEIILAFKGFSMWKVFPIVREYIQKATASSLFEAKLAFEEMKTKAHTYAPIYLENEFDEISKYSSHITFNSLNQLKKFENKITPGTSIGIRVNPEFSDVETELYNPCAPGSRLGLLAEQLPDKLPPIIEGLHFHSLCESGSETLEKTLESFERKFEKHIHQVKWINMGGGHLITRKDYDINLLIDTLQKFQEKYNVKVILEPGAAFVWETGYLVSTVQDIVENKGIKTAMLDVSFTAHMPDCLEMPYKPKIMNSLEPTSDKPTYRMGGNSCLAGDYMGDWSFENELKESEKIIFEDMIHYTMVKTNMFNGVKHPSIAMWTIDDQIKVFRHFNYTDFKSRLS
jgi:carboxynorspermidine decarboxylase